jgi:hypothetical protein
MLIVKLPLRALKVILDLQLLKNIQECSTRVNLSSLPCLRRFSDGILTIHV